MAGQPKAPFYIAVLLVVGGLVGFAAYNANFFGSTAPTDGGGGDAAPIQPPDVTSQAEADDGTDIAAAEEWDYVVTERLTPVEGVSNYTPMKDRTVRFALNVWAGWAPIIYANGGGAAGRVWKDADGNDFQVELVLIDDPKVMQDAYVSGDVHIGWSTLDMVPLMMERLVDAQGRPDSRVMPRIVQQVDWSSGGDGIVVRDYIKEVKDLRGKTIALAQNSPSHYFALNMLVASGVQPHEVTFRFTPDAFKAAAAFESDKNIDACVSWAPDIYTLTEVDGNSMLVDTGTANRLIADVWFARADFARDHGPIIEGLVRGIFDSMEELKQQPNRIKCAKLMADLYSIPADETIEMFADAQSTNWGDNYQFFVNKKYLANFQRVWDNAYRLYRRIDVIEKPKVSFDKVMDNTYITKLGEEEKYKSQVTKQAVFTPHEISSEQVEDTAFLTTTHYIHFFPNNSDIYHKIVRKVDGKDVEELYDPNVDLVLEQIGERIGQFERSRIVIEGHADGSMKGQVDENLVKSLSYSRADSVRNALVDKFELDPNRFQVTGVGWDRPVEGHEFDHGRNRRVEVRILPAEAQ